MSLLGEYQDRYTHPPTDQAKKILFDVLDDILGRKGFDYGWDECGSEIREEILQTNLAIVQGHL